MSKRKFVFFLWIAGNDTVIPQIYQIHFDCIRYYRHLFTDFQFILSRNPGVTDETVRMYQKEIIDIVDGRNVSFKITENDNNMGEALEFYNEVDQKMDDYDGLVFYAHGKGISRYYYNIMRMRHWVLALYFLNLNYIDEVEDNLRYNKYYSYGAFKTYAPDYNFFEIKNHWYYSGSFIWLNPGRISYDEHYMGKERPKPFSAHYSEIYPGSFIDFEKAYSHNGLYTKSMNYYVFVPYAMQQLMTSEEYKDYAKFYWTIMERHHDIPMFTSDMINRLITERNLDSYLEIGLDLPTENYLLIATSNKESCDPFKNPEYGEEADAVINECLTYHMTSDEMFERMDPDRKYDIIFIDGLHKEEQVIKDIVNSMHHLNVGGYIVLHDCLPRDYESQLEEKTVITWNGSVWKAIPKLKELGIEYYTVDSDEGTCIIKYNDSMRYIDYYDKSPLQFEDYVNNRNTLMNVISKDDFINNKYMIY